MKRTEAASWLYHSAGQGYSQRQNSQQAGCSFSNSLTDFGGKGLPRLTPSPAPADTSVRTEGNKKLLSVLSPTDAAGRLFPQGLYLPQQTGEVCVCDVFPHRSTEGAAGRDASPGRVPCSHQWQERVSSGRVPGCRRGCERRGREIGKEKTAPTLTKPASLSEHRQSAFCKARTVCTQK